MPYKRSALVDPRVLPHTDERSPPSLDVVYQADDGRWYLGVAIGTAEEVKWTAPQSSAYLFSIWKMVMMSLRTSHLIEVYKQRRTCTRCHAAHTGCECKESIMQLEEVRKDEGIKVHPDRLRLRSHVMDGVINYPVNGGAATALVNMHERPRLSRRFRAYGALSAFILNSLCMAFSVAAGYEIRTTVGPAVSWQGFGVLFGVTLGIAVAVYSVFYWLYGFGGGMVAPVQPLILDPDATAELFCDEATRAYEECRRDRFMMVTTHNAVVAPSVVFNTASYVYVQTHLGGPHTAGIMIF